MAALIPRDWQVTDTLSTLAPHVATVVAVRNLMVKRGTAWAVAGPCGCPALLLGAESTRREVSDYGTVFYRHRGFHEPPPWTDLHACLRWVESRALEIGLVPCDPDQQQDPEHGHGLDRVPPRDRQGWTRTTATAWPLLPTDPLILRDLDTGEHRLCPDADVLATLFDDTWPSSVPGPLPALADVLRTLSVDQRLVPTGLPPKLLRQVIEKPGLGPHGHRDLIRLLRRLRDPQPSKLKWDSVERSVIRDVRREVARIHGAAVLLPSDFERGPDGGITLDGLDPGAWIAAVRAPMRPAPDLET